MLAPLEFGHRNEIVREQAVGLYQRASCGVERRVAEPMTEAQEMLLENRFLGNVWVFVEVRFQVFVIRFMAQRDVFHLTHPFDYTLQNFSRSSKFVVR
jgi:hypothetical protein